MVLANNDHRRALTETIISLCIALFRNQQDMVTHPDLRTAEEIYTWCLWTCSQRSAGGVEHRATMKAPRPFLKIKATISPSPAHRTNVDGRRRFRKSTGTDVMILNSECMLRAAGVSASTHVSYEQCESLNACTQHT